MPPVTPQTSLTITNPLVLYRSLLATKRIEPDPAQHRLALHLQKLYHRLKDYEPEIDFRHRIVQISRIANHQAGSSKHTHDHLQKGATKQHKGVFRSFQERKEKTEATALTRRLTEPESAIQLQSPQGLLLYGEVGTGKSLLVDILADCLPNRKKRRWHFNTFMLETFARLEHFRKSRMDTVGHETQPEEYSLLRLARDMISTSPILFLDEFQLPDRAASKILSNLLTSFFHLGGVLIATSNRMPEELANASGMEFTPPPSSKLGRFRGRWGLLGKGTHEGKSEDRLSGKGEIAVFLEVLKARCEVWDMEGGKDWRRREAEDRDSNGDKDASEIEARDESFHGLEPMVDGNLGLGYEQSTRTETAEVKGLTEKASKTSLSKPSYYFVSSPTNEEPEVLAELDEKWKACEFRSIRSSLDPASQEQPADIPWQTTTLTVFARPLLVPRHYNGVTKWTFDELCARNLGPADYVTLASTFHTFILDSVPVLTLLQKNEARRLITLLDALYECRCKLLISAEAGPDDTFFPETLSTRQGEAEGRTDRADGVYPETFAEIFQDRTSPFRPNVSSYENDAQSASSIPSPSSSPSSLPPSASSSSSSSYTPTASPPSYTPTTSSPLSSTRTILADEDSDFGPILGRHSSSSSPSHLPRGSSDGAPGAGNEIGRSSTSSTGPDFSKTGAYTGEDERFAYKRASSRLWEMCGSRWWAREGEGWWRPLGIEARSWEGKGRRGEELKTVAGGGGTTTVAAIDGARRGDDDALFRHGASPFRTAQEPPPKFGFVHAWGMMRWGRKAGLWGKGVEGLAERDAGRGGGKREGEGGK